MYSLSNKDFSYKVSLNFYGLVAQGVSFGFTNSSKILINSWGAGVFNFSKFNFNDCQGSISKSVLSSILGYLLLVPVNIFDIESEDLRKKIIIRLVLGCPFVRSVYVDSKEEIENYISILKKNWDSFLFDLEEGDFTDWDSLPKEVQRQIKPLIRSKPEWSEVLRIQRKNLLVSGSDIKFEDLFPNLETIWGEKAWESLPGPAPCQRKSPGDNFLIHP